MLTRKMIRCHVIYTKGKNLIYVDGLKQGIDKIDYEIARKWDASPQHVFKTYLVVS